MKKYYKFFQIPGVGNLAGGLPNVQFFPFDSLEAQAAKPERWTPTPNHPGVAEMDLASGLKAVKIDSDPGASSHMDIPKVVSETDPVKKIDLATALQYGTAQGYPPLYSWVRQFTREHLHPNVPYQDGPEVILTCGSTDGFSKTLQLFVDPWTPAHDVRDRPGLLCESFIYGNILSQSQPLGVQFVPVVADDGGMVATGPGSLEDVLSNWDDAKGRRPHLMYTVTLGHNPTGVVLSVQRRRELYAVCQKYDVIIVEDDPYWHLQFPSAEVEEAKSRHRPPPQSVQEFKPTKSSGYEFLDSLTPSFLSIDTDGRVVRIDTFSKTIAPGCRLGWLTAQPALIQRYLMITETSTQQPSGFVQSMVAELVMGPQPAAARAAFAALRTAKERATFSGWKMDGWVRWLAGLRGAYERRMNRMCRILDDGSARLGTARSTHPSDADWGIVTKTPLFDFKWPRGGMFVWLRVHFERHPLWGARRTDGEGMIDGTAISTALLLYLVRKPFLVIVSTGLMFSATEKVRTKMGWAFFRLCFAAETEENVDAASQRFVEGLHSFWRIRKVEQLQDILGDAPFSVGTARNFSEEVGNLGGFGC
ncbi:hypothetical protein VTK73DRAFT_1607 [Phialemonium thermophilum]|uniref:Aminotransferase class I/classII large domain-containing protein n=1 Tax=Phialemonium thermophilum TaxID=223376 RepID=A0ABR3Y436_9PEZI